MERQIKQFFNNYELVRVHGYYRTSIVDATIRPTPVLFKTMTKSITFEEIRQFISNDDVISLSRNASSLKEHANAKDVNGRGLYHAAVHAQAGDSIAWLNDHKIGSIDAADNQGETPLMRAAFLGYKAGVELLLEGGADIHAQSLNGGTALHSAFAGGKKALNVIESLVEAGADASIVDKDGRKPEQWAQEALLREKGKDLLDKMNAIRPRLSISRPKV